MADLQICFSVPVQDHTLDSIKFSDQFSNVPRLEQQDKVVGITDGQQTDYQVQLDQQQPDCYVLQKRRAGVSLWNTSV